MRQPPEQSWQKALAVQGGRRVVLEAAAAEAEEEVPQQWTLMSWVWPQSMHPWRCPARASHCQQSSRVRVFPSGHWRSSSGQSCGAA